MASVTVGGALGAGIRAVAREAWLVPLGMAAGLARSLLLLPATAFAVAVAFLVLRSTMPALALPGPRAAAAESWLLALAASPRFRGIALGLWLAGWLLGAALRTAWIAGALPVLASRLSGRAAPPGTFARGVAYRSAGVLVTSAASLLLDLLGQAAILLVAAGALLLVAPGRAQALPLAWVAASAAGAAVVIAATLSTLGDVAVARAALAGEGPARALGASLRAVAHRPAAFLATSLAVGIGLALAAGTVDGLVGLLATTVPGRNPAAALAPQFLLASLGALVAAGAELWRLSALGTLALAGYPGGRRSSSLRSDSLGIRPPIQ